MASTGADTAERAESRAVQRFHHRSTPGCDCPIHQSTPADRGPFTAPLGYRFADDVHVADLPRSSAAAIYDAHHSYMSDLPTVNLSHHGLYYQDCLTGAITYRFPLLGRKAVYRDACGELVPAPFDYADLPRTLRPTARRILPATDEADVAERVVESGDEFIEAARVCLGVRMPNLASCALARSQERAAATLAREHDASYLLTFVRADFDAAMVRALRDKGWRCVGVTEPSQAGNRDAKPIRDRYKWVFLCDLARLEEQADLGRWT